MAILDPIGDPDWGNVTFRTDDPAELIRWLHENPGAFVFVDECGEVFNEGQDKTYAWLATRSRHWGHSVSFIAQRGIQVPKTMRDQCERLYLFTSSVSDGKLHEEEWNEPLLADCNKIPQLHFYCVQHYKPTRYFRIDPATGRIYAVKGGSVDIEPE